MAAEVQVEVYAKPGDRVDPTAIELALENLGYEVLPITVIDLP